MARSSKDQVRINDPVLKKAIEAFCENVRVKRSKTSMSQQDLATASSLSLATVSEIEQKRVEDLRLSTVTAIGKGLGEKDPFKLLK